VGNHRENGIVEDTKHLTKYVVWVGSLTVNGLWVDVPNNPYLMWYWLSVVEDVNDHRSQREKPESMLYRTLTKHLVTYSVHCMYPRM